MTGRVGLALNETDWCDALECLWALGEREKMLRRTEWLSAGAHYRKPADHVDPSAYTQWDGTPFPGTVGDLAEHVDDLRSMARHRQAKDRGKNIRRAMLRHGWSESEAVSKLGYTNDDYVLPD